MQHADDRPAFALLYLGRQQRLKIAGMGLPCLGGFVRQAHELTADRRHAQCLAVLPNGLVLQVAHHAVPAQGLERSSTS